MIRRAQATLLAKLCDPKDRPCLICDARPGEPCTDQNLGHELKVFHASRMTP